jgi:single-strand DNA-binding protein
MLSVAGEKERTRRSSAAHFNHQQKCKVMVTLLGRVTKDATVKNLDGGKAIVNFSIALNDNYKDKEGKVVELATYINCAYWNKTKIAPYLTKGKLVQMEARLTPEAYTNKDGEAVGVIRANVRKIELLGGMPDKPSAKKKSGKTKQSKEPVIATEGNDDLPF